MRNAYLDVLHASGVDAKAARARLAGLSVAVLGLDASGAHAAALLAQCGVGRLVVVDPTPLTPADLGAWPLLPPAGSLGRSRALALARALRKRVSADRVRVAAGPELAKADIADLAGHVDLMIACFGNAFARISSWVNQASIAQHTPALFSETALFRAWVGPLVLPGETACLLCYRMRRVACEPDFEAAMRAEEKLDRRRAVPSPLAPALGAYVGSLLASQALSFLVGPPSLSLAGRIIEFDGLSFESRSSHVLPRADCPACAAKKKAPGLLRHAAP